MSAIAAGKSGGNPVQLIAGECADRIRELELFARLRVQGAMQGANKSTFKGSTSDFLQHRQYYPGDNLKYLDWRVYGKSGRLYIREFEELTNSQLTVILDVSGSMASGGAGMKKHEFAVRNAAILLHLANLQRDQFSIAFFRNQRVMYAPFRSGRSHLTRIFGALLDARAEGETDFVRGIEASAAHVRRRGLIVVLSDFMDDPDKIVRQLAALRYRNSDMIALQIFDPVETDLDFNTVTRFHDTETGGIVVVDPLLVRKEYRLMFQAHQEALREGCRRHRIDFAALPAGDDYERPIFSYLRWRMGGEAGAGG